MLDSRTEIRAGQRFAFGANWQSFIRLVDDERIAVAISSLTQALGVKDLSGKTFLDVGCGSGLFSLAAHRLGARVRSFDFDLESAAATSALRRRFASDREWVIDVGSILDPAYTAGLGRFDVVYSWGVLHHTGQMWTAVAATADLVAAGGQLFVSIYNDQGRPSRTWLRVKRRYNRSGRAGRLLLVGLSALYLRRHWPVRKLARIFRPGPGPARPVKAVPRTRGMSRRHDLLDWVGGYPFEFARPEAVFRFVRERGFELRYLTTCGGGLGCNEYVFERVGDGGRDPVA
jgi:2-polyprenyl-6-hydroxyphenyl methylase/3-demethylubiquinone-9 3-methyltransferase